MPSLYDLFNPTFLIFLGILVLVVALLVVYFESKMRDQNHKIASMLSLVSTLAEDMNGVKMGLNHLAMTRYGGSVTVPLNTFANNEKNNLIEVSDDEEEEDEEEEEEEDLDGVEEDELDEDELEEDELEEDEDLDENLDEEIKVLKLDLNNDIDETNLDFHNIDELENQLSSNFNDIEESKPVEFNNDSNIISSSDFKTININLEESVDYKKFPLNKLRSIVIEKGFVTDASKFKKNELLKLLGIE